MKPFKRPDSAKSGHTKLTKDSQLQSKDLNSSKFSETFTTGVKLSDQKNNDFEKYLQEKNKDPRFNQKYAVTNLPKIQQNPRNNQVPKIKPFDKKISKISKPSPKVQQDPKVEDVINQDNYSSLSFAQKNKKKMNSLKVSEKLEESPTKEKSKINFDGFTVNHIGKRTQKHSNSIVKKEEAQSSQKEETAIKYKKQVKQEIKIENKKNGKKAKNQEQQKREEMKQDLENFITKIEKKNQEYYPDYYQEFIDRSSQICQIDKINIADFMNSSPNEMDYHKMAKRIQQFDKKIETGKQEESIDLDAIIDGQEDEIDNQQSSQLAMSSMSTDELQKRNLFVTQILKGKISKEQINKIQTMDKQRVKLIKQKTQKQQDDEEEFEVTAINMKKKKLNRLMEKNKLQAGGQLYKDCDYLSQEDQLRLEYLLNNQIPQSPYQLTKEERQQNRKLEEAIRMYQQLNAQDRQCEQFLYEENLPKDPVLRKEAENKMIRERINNVNERLKKIDEYSFNRVKIQKLIQKYKKRTKVSKMGQKILQEKKKQFEEEQKLIQEAEQILDNAVKDKHKIEQSLRQMQIQFSKLNGEVLAMINKDSQELKKQALDQLKSKMQSVLHIEEVAKNLQYQLKEFEKQSQNIKQSIREMTQIPTIDTTLLHYQNFNPNQTIEDIDKMITLRLDAADKIIKQLSEQTSKDHI